MTILVTGLCGFVGSRLAESLLARREGLAIIGIDNLIRPGSETNRARLNKLGIAVTHGDLRQASDLDSLPRADWAIDAAANASVLAGVDGKASSRQLMQHNLGGSIETLEYAKRHGAGFVLLSSNRVYSVNALAALPVRVKDNAFELDAARPLPTGVSAAGIGPEFSTAAPISLYGASKLASEIVALEYGSAFGFPVWINRCGVMAGPGQFGTPDQGVFSYWIHAHKRRLPLRYIGFEGHGHQTRDLLDPADLAALTLAQMDRGRADGRRLYTAGGGPANAVSLRQLNDWCDARFGPHTPAPDLRPRPFDIPWAAMDNEFASADFGWRPERSVQQILGDIAAHADSHPDWLEISGVL